VIPVFRRESHSSPRGAVRADSVKSAATSGSTPLEGEEEPRGRAARLSVTDSASGQGGSARVQSTLPGDDSPLTPQEQRQLDRLLSRYVRTSVPQPPDVVSVPGPSSRSDELPAIVMPCASASRPTSQAEVMRLAEQLTTSGSGRADVVMLPGPTGSGILCCIGSEVGWLTHFRFCGHATG
jgi:hypothetical protein